LSKVAIICLCFNHEAFVAEALESVFQQTYKNWELIVVDDASVDNSASKIEAFKKKNSSVNLQTIYLDKNIGNCKAFNKALALTNADYIVDLAADDVLLPERVALAVEAMETNNNIALNFSNANYINEKGEILNSHYPVDSEGKTKIVVPEDDVFTEIIKRYYICSPTMVYRASYLKKLGGYDENLAYEDFDIKIRLARHYPFSYTDRILVHKRVLKSAMSQKQYKRGNLQLASTFIICCKIYLLINNRTEKKALLKRINFEAKQSFLYGRVHIFFNFTRLWVKTFLKK
jgi:glycosyltransferase involved in cell wall biosynthesis